MPRVVVVVVTHNSAHDLERCGRSLERALGGRGEASPLVVDNGSTDGTPQRLRAAFPDWELIANAHNLGFAAACNLGIRRARELGAEFVYLLNPDTEVEPDFLARALEVAAASERVGAVQSLLLLDPERHLVDSAGNAIHFLGFGYCLGHRRPRAEVDATPSEIGFPSGAAVLLRRAALDAVGELDEELFLYGEDLDLGWRLWMGGFECRLAARSLVYHRHEFARSPEKYFLLERNRWLVLRKNLSRRSLAVLYPWLLLDELALVVIAASQGWFGQKVRSWRALLDRGLRARRRAARRQVQALRVRDDREVLARCTTRMDVPGVTGPLIRRLVNPCLGLLWRGLRPLL